MFSAAKDAAAHRAVFEEIVELLLSAGYFRARIQALSEYDKIIGGLCWAITASGKSVDVDLFFQENSTIGQKIKLSENIVKALRGMRCPYPLQAHQIQGGDFPAVLPIIKWCVKSVIETRQATGDLVRLFSELQFGKEIGRPEDDAAPASSSSFLESVLERYRPRRKFKNEQDLSGASEEERVYSCLLEYGDKVSSRSAEDADKTRRESASGSSEASKPRLAGFEKQYARAQAAAQAEEKARMERARNLQASMMGQMAEQKGLNASGKKAAGIVGLGTDAIRKAGAAFDEKTAALEREQGTRVPTTRRGRAAGRRRELKALNRKIAAAEAKAHIVRKALAIARGKLESVASEQEKAKKYNQRVENEISKLDELENSSKFKDDLASLKRLVLLNENLKQQESSFKKNCKSQLAKLKSDLAGLKSDADESEDAKRLRDIEEMYASMQKKMQKLQKLLAKRSQEVALVSRQIDDVPTRSELLQYERRFVELYETVGRKLDENRKHVGTYNTLERIHGLLSKECSLIQSVTDNFQVAMKSKAGREQFITQMEGIIKGLDQNVEQSKSKRDAANEEREAKQEELQTLLQRQRKYFRTVKEFQEACELNEKLSKKLEA